MKKHIYNFLLRVLRFFTRIYLWRTKPRVIGITGSVGKTTCRDIIFQVLCQVQDSQKIYTSPKNYNSELGLIFSIFCIEEYSPSIKNLFMLTWKILLMSLFLRKKYDVLVAEYGIDSPWDMDFLLSVMRPEIGIITKLDAVHSENFPWWVEQYWQDKAKLLIASKAKVYFPWNDSFLQNKKYSFPENREEMYHQEPSVKYKQEAGNIFQEFRCMDKKISLNLIGNENTQYTKIALEIAKNLGINVTEKEYIFHFHLQPWRFSLFSHENHLFIDSTYNASPESMKLILQNTKLIRRQMYPKYKMLYVLWDMRELGDISHTEHKQLAHEIIDAAGVFTVGPEMYKWLVPELHELQYAWKIHSSLSSREVGKKLQEFLDKHKDESYVILFKGSQNTIFIEEALWELLPDNQRKNLVRQSPDWKKKKQDFFESL